MNEAEAQAILFEKWGKGQHTPEEIDNAFEEYLRNTDNPSGAWVPPDIALWQTAYGKRDFNREYKETK